MSCEELAACYENFKKIDNELTEACIVMELQRCKAEESAAQYRAEYFHKSTQAWLVGRQKMSMLEARLPVGTLTDAQTNEIFHPVSQPDAARKLPLYDLQAMRKKLHELREILEKQVKQELKEI